MRSITTTKFGMEMRAEFHAALKARAKRERRKLYQVLDEALASYLAPSTTGGAARKEEIRVYVNAWVKARLKERARALVALNIPTADCARVWTIELLWQIIDRLVDDPGLTLPPLTESSGPTVRDPERLAEMIRMRKDGATLEEIGEKFGLTKQGAQQMLSPLRVK